MRSGNRVESKKGDDYSFLRRKKEKDFRVNQVKPKKRAHNLAPLTE